MTDPRFTDPRLSDPVLRHDEPIGGTWAWLAGIAVIALIAFLVIAGVNKTNTAGNDASPATTGSATRQMSPPASTGAGSTSPRPAMPAPTMPAPSKDGTR